MLLMSLVVFILNNAVMFVNPEQKQTGITPDTICYTTNFWRKFEIGEKKIIYFSSLIDIN